MTRFSERVKLSLLLSVPIFLMMVWVLAMSTSPLLQTLGLGASVTWAAVASLISAYFITTFTFEVRHSSSEIIGQNNN